MPRKRNRPWPLLLGLLIFLAFSGSPAGAGELSVRINGNQVVFDWSAMQAGPPYTLAIAAEEQPGLIDMSSLNFIAMGSRTSHSTSGLPSGMVFNAILLGSGTSGPQPSNSVRFTTLTSTITVPENGDTLLHMDNPDGLTEITFFGSHTKDTATISRITGNYGAGPFELELSGNRPESYHRGELALVFSYPADGSVVVEKVAAPDRTDKVTDCQQEIEQQMHSIVRNHLETTNEIKVLLAHLIISNLEIYTNISFASASDKNNVNAPPTWLLAPANEAEINLLSSLNHRRDWLKEQFAELELQYENCQSTNQNDNYECTIPTGAEFHQTTFSSGSVVEYYTLNGVNVGPYHFWNVGSGGKLYLDRQSCNNSAGQLDGWAIAYLENGSRTLQTHYVNGVIDGHEYVFYDDDTVKIDRTYVDGTAVHSESYCPDGSLESYWDISDGVAHIIGGCD